MASQNGHTETVALLLQKGARINIQGNEGVSSLMLATQKQFRYSSKKELTLICERTTGGLL